LYTSEKYVSWSHYQNHAYSTRTEKLNPVSQLLLHPEVVVVVSECAAILEAVIMHLVAVWEVVLLAVNSMSQTFVLPILTQFILLDV